jgi:hypothetical protein
MTPTYEQAKQWFTPLRELRFWRKVDKTPEGCWLWRGALTDTGHGACDFDGDSVRVHRLTWILARQRDIPEGLVIRHLMCDNKPCCNPAHVVGGTQGENVNDIWLIHRPYDVAKEQEVIAEYLKHPYVGYFSDFVQCNEMLTLPMAA